MKLSRSAGSLIVSAFIVLSPRAFLTGVDGARSAGAPAIHRRLTGQHYDRSAPQPVSGGEATGRASATAKGIHEDGAQS